MKNAVERVVIYACGLTFGFMIGRTSMKFKILRRINKISGRRSRYTDEIIFDTRDDAELAITRMQEIIDKYTYATVADFRDLVGLTTHYTDNNYGWTNIKGARTVRVRNGYIVDFAKRAEQLMKG